MPMLRNVRAQNTLSVDLHDSLRSWHIYKRSDAHLERDLPGGFAVALRAVLRGLDMVQIMRASLTLFTGFVGVPMKGLDILACTSEDGLVQRQGLTFDDLLFVADRLSMSATEIAERWYAGVLALPEHERKFARDPWTLAPLLRLDPSFPGVPAATGHYFSVSPWDLAWRISQTPFELIDALRPTESRNLRAYLGKGIEDYLQELLERWCGRENVVRLDDVLGENEGRGDFVVFAGAAAILIETTRSVGTWEMRSSFPARQLLDLFDHLAELNDTPHMNCNPCWPLEALAQVLATRH